MVNPFYEKMQAIIGTSEALFYRHYDEEHSYSDLAGNIRRLNAFLHRFRGKRIGVFGEKGYPVYCGVFATMLGGNAWVPLTPATPDRRNAEMIELAEVDAILTDRDLPEAMADAANRRKTEIADLAALMSGTEAVDIPTPDFHKDDVAIIYFTSGSTGVPKGVPVTHENYILNVENILRLIEFRPPEVFADYHDLGFVISVPILFPCVMTESAVSPAIDAHDQFMPVDHMIENRVSVLITVPSTIARIRKMKRGDKRIEKLNVLVSCGEPLHLDVLDFALSGMDANHIYNFYGSTEVAPWTFHHVCGVEDLETYKSFGYIPIGRPIDGNNIRISGEGELQVSGPQVVPGYLGGVGADRFPVEDGKRWYFTGDKVVRHDDVYICKGRLDSQVKLGGRRVELMDVESHLRALEGVEAAVCFTIGEDAEKRIAAVMMTARDYDLGAVRDFLAERLPAYMLPRQVFCTADAPLNKSGKIDRARILAEYAGA